MTFENSIRITDIISIVAIFAGPIVAVQLTEYLREQKETRRRKINIFKTLMATRQTILDQKHVQSLNLVEIEFHGLRERRVVDTLRLYIAHLNLNVLPQEGNQWDQRRKELLAAMLYEMAKVLNFNFDQSQIQTGSYSPQGWLTTGVENEQTRKLWLEVLNGTRTLNCFNAPQPSPRPVTQPTPKA